MPCIVLTHTTQYTYVLRKNSYVISTHISWKSNDFTKKLKKKNMWKLMGHKSWLWYIYETIFSRIKNSSLVLLYSIRICWNVFSTFVEISSCICLSLFTYHVQLSKQIGATMQTNGKVDHLLTTINVSKNHVPIFSLPRK